MLDNRTALAEDGDLMSAAAGVVVAYVDLIDAPAHDSFWLEMVLQEKIQELGFSLNAIDHRWRDHYGK